MDPQIFHELLTFLDSIANDPELDLPRKKQATVLAMFLMQNRNALVIPPLH